MVNVFLASLEQSLLLTAPPEMLTFIAGYGAIVAGVLYSLGVEVGTYSPPLNCLGDWSRSSYWFRRHRYRALLFQELHKRRTETPDGHVDADTGAIAPGDYPGVEWLTGRRHLDDGATGGALVRQAITVVALPGFRRDPAARVIGEVLPVCAQPGVP